MNSRDATVMTMFGCFTDFPNFTAFEVVLNEVPLDEMNEELSDYFFPKAPIKLAGAGDL